MAIAPKGGLNTAAHASSASSFQIFSSSAVSIAEGDFCVLVVVTDNLQAADGASSDHTSVTGGTGTWNKLGEYTFAGAGGAANGLTVSLWLFEAAAVHGGGIAFTINLSEPVVEKCASWFCYSKDPSKSIRLVQGLAANPIANQLTGANFGSITFSDLPNSPKLLFRGLGKEANATTLLTQTAGFSFILGTRSRNNANAVLVRGEFRVEPSATSVTSNPTMSTSGDTAGLFAALEEYSDAHELTAEPLETGAATLGTPSLGQLHALVAQGLVSGAPALSPAPLEQAHSLIAAGLVTDLPDLPAPSLHVTHLLTTTALVSGTPQLGQSALTQAHALAGSGLAAGVPYLETPSLAVEGQLLAVGITSGVPTLGGPTVRQHHLLATGDLAVGAPVLPAASMAQGHQLAANDVATGDPSLASPALGQTGTLAATNLVTQPATLGAPTLAQVHTLAANDNTAGPPTLGTPTLLGPLAYHLTATPLAAGATSLGRPALVVIPHTAPAIRVVSGGSTRERVVVAEHINRVVQAPGRTRVVSRRS